MNETITKTNKMASVKNLKKDIDYLMAQIVNDCFYVMEHNSKVDNAEVLKIARHAIAVHQELRKRAMHPNGKKEKKLVREYYNKLIKDLLQSADEAFEKLSSEVKKTL